MKKFFAVMVYAVAMLFAVVTNANAQSVDPEVAFNDCRENVLTGDDFYADGEFETAKTYYMDALKNNVDCPKKKYMSDRKINKKISNCDYALKHNGKTREQRDEEVSQAIGTVLAVGVIAGAIATAASGHDAPHHDHHVPDFHHDHHHDYHHHHRF